MTTTTTSAEQLSWLPEPTVPARFRLDEATRRRGLTHVALIRARLAEAEERRVAARAAESRTARRQQTGLTLAANRAASTEPVVSIAPAAVDTHAA